MLAVVVPVGADAAAAGAAIAAAITGTLHAAPFITERRSKLAFGSAELLISDICYPKFLSGGERPHLGKLMPSFSATSAECTEKNMNLQYQDALFSGHSNGRRFSMGEGADD